MDDQPTSPADESSENSPELPRGADEAIQAFQNGMQQARQLIRQRPVESIAVAFGAGIVVGAVISVLMSKD